MVNDRSQDTYFLHADGDSFFVACELVARPELRGKPVVVGEDRGIAVAMSAEAKALGVTRGMPVFQIRKLYPEVILLTHHFEVYKKISDGVFQILSSYLDTVEVYSIDECFAVVTPADIRLYGRGLPAKEAETYLLRQIQEEIKALLGVTYSFGLARTKALAKTASKLKKPNGAVVLLSPEDEALALQNTPIDDIWGIGRRTVPRLLRMGMKTAYDFVQYPTEEIRKHFSEPLFVLQCELGGQAIHGVHADADPRDQKSIQSTGTFRPPSTDPKVIWAEIAENAENACSNARDLHLLTRSVSFFVKTTDFSYRFSDVKMALYTADPGVVLNAIESRFLRVLRSGEKIRSTGVILHELRREEDVPRDLFGRQAKAISDLAIEVVADKVRAKFGHGALKRLASLRGSGKEKHNSFPKHSG